MSSKIALTIQLALFITIHKQKNPAQIAGFLILFSTRIYLKIITSEKI